MINEHVHRADPYFYVRRSASGVSPGPGTWVDPYTFNFQRKDSKILCRDPVSELDHSVAWPEILYGIDSLFGGVRTLTQCETLPLTVHVYWACIRLFADGPLTGTF